jgi:hypothetical protein
MLARTYFEAGAARTYLVRDTVGTFGAFGALDGRDAGPEGARLGGAQPP